MMTPVKDYTADVHNLVLKIRVTGPKLTKLLPDVKIW